MLHAEWQRMTADTHRGPRLSAQRSYYTRLRTSVQSDRRVASLRLGSPHADLTALPFYGTLWISRCESAVRASSTPSTLRRPAKQALSGR